MRIGAEDAEVLPSLRAAIEKHRGISAVREIDAVLGKGRVTVARM